MPAMAITWSAGCSASPESRASLPPTVRGAHQNCRSQLAGEAFELATCGRARCGRERQLATALRGLPVVPRRLSRELRSLPQVRGAHQNGRSQLAGEAFELATCGRARCGRERQLATAVTRSAGCSASPESRASLPPTVRGAHQNGRSQLAGEAFELATCGCAGCGRERQLATAVTRSAGCPASPESRASLSPTGSWRSPEL